MTPERARTILAAHGADPAHWPEAERAALAALIARDPALASWRDAEARLDRVMALPALAPLPGLAGRIASATVTVPQTAAPGWDFGLGWARAAALAAALAMGLGLGLSGVGASESNGALLDQVLNVEEELLP